MLRCARGAGRSSSANSSWTPRCSSAADDVEGGHQGDAHTSRTVLLTSAEARGLFPLCLFLTHCRCAMACRASSPFCECNYIISWEGAPSARGRGSCNGADAGVVSASVSVGGCGGGANRLRQVQPGRVRACPGPGRAG